jgi:hypothetical protein
MPFCRDEIDKLRGIIDAAVADLPPKAQKPLAEMIASHRIPREVRRAKHDAHNMQAVLAKEYGASADQPDQD